MSLSYSAIQDYQRCPTKFYWRNVADLQPIRKNVAFFWGSEAHGMFQVFYLEIQRWQGHGDKVDAQQKALNAFEDHVAERRKAVDNDPMLFAEEQASAGSMVEEAADMVRRYLTRYHDESWEILHVEEQFTYTDEGGDVQITFTPDLVIRDRNGFVWIVDWKTTKGSVPDTPDIPFDDLQALTYAAGIKPMYPKLKGFIFVRLRKKSPTLPRLNTRKSSDGYVWVNNLKQVDTTYELLHAVCKEYDLLDHPAHALRLAELKETEKYHWRETIIVTDAMIAQAEQELAITSEHVELSNQAGDYYRVYSPNPFDGCKSCPYHSLCRSEIVGWNTEAIIEEEFETRDMSYKEYETEEEPF